MSRRQVVQPRGADEFLRSADQCGGLSIRCHQIEGQNIRRINIGDTGQPPLRRDQFPDFRGVFQSDNRHKMSLGIELEAFLPNLSEEMNREIRNPYHRAAKINQVGPRRVSVAHCGPTRQRKITVQPGVQQNTTIGFDSQLAITGCHSIRPRLQTKVGRIRMRPDHSKAGLSRRSGTRFEGDQAAISPNHVRTLSRAMGPDRGFLKTPKTVGLKPTRHFRHGMVRRG